ncbi:hypothetical protein AXX16_4096 [Serratia rubidaea]|nr:hypothetical protein AXX16_4096 [Serratia rubidaea]
MGHKSIFNVKYLFNTGEFNFIYNLFLRVKKIIQAEIIFLHRNKII